LSEKNERPATPEQISKIESFMGESIDDFVKTFTDENKRKLFTENLAKRLKQTEWLTSLSSGQGRYQPIYSQQVFQQININPVSASSTQIEQWLLSPQYYDQNIRHLSQYLSYSVGQYNRSIWYLNTIKSFNYMLLPSDSNIENTDDKEYMHSYDICLRTLQKMNIKYQIPKVDLQVMQDGIAPYWVSETNDTISLLPLPSDYCYITAPWTYGYLFAIDLVFFDKFVSMPQQIPELCEAYEKFVEMRKAIYEKKKPREELAPFQYYQVPPDKGWVFVWNPVMPDKLPPLTSSMASALDTLSYKELLKNKIALDLFKVIALKIPLDKDNKQMVVTYKLAEEITQVIQSLLPDNIKCYSSPFDSEPIVTDQANRFDEIVNVSNDTFYASAGINKNLMGGKDSKQGTALQISSMIDFNYASEHTYIQYANFVNFQLGLKTKKHKFQVQFFGNALRKDEELKQACETVRTCNTGFLKMFAAQGMEPFQVKSTLILEDKLGLRDLMQPLVSGFNSKSDDGGRPAKTDSNLSDGGAGTRDYGQSETKSFSLNTCLYCKEPLNSMSIENFCDESCQELYADYILDQL